MPYDPDDLYKAEPKLLSLDCFPIFFIQPVLPPDYDIAMAENTRYHRLSEENRVSMESSIANLDVDPGLLLLDPTRSNDDNTPPKKEYKLSCHPTLYFRLLAIVLLVPAFALLIKARRGNSIPAIIFICFSFIRNILVLLHHVLSKQLRIKFSVELRGRAPASTQAHATPSRSCPEWLKQGILHVFLDLILVVFTLITTIIANKGINQWYGYGWHNFSHEFLPGCVLAYIGVGFYFLACFDLGKPSNITTTHGISFDFSKGKKGERPGQPPQFYRDVEAAGGLAGAESHKSGADSPVII